MVEDSGWAAPAGEPEPPRYGERVPGWTPPAPGPGSGPLDARPTAPGGDAPPPRRGLVPLHPLGFGELLGAAFAAIRWNPRATVLPALIVAVLQGAISVALSLTVVADLANRVARAATQADRLALTAGDEAGGALGLLAVLVVSVLGDAVLQGVIVTVVARGALGERPAFARVARPALRRFGALAVVGLIRSGALLVAAVVVVVLIALIAQLGIVGIVLAVLVGLAGFAALAVGYAFLTIKLALAPSALVLEGLSLRAAIARSWRLVRGAFWRTLGLLLLVGVIVYAAEQLVSLPFTLIGAAAGGLLNPDAGTTGQSLTTANATTVVPAAIATTIIGGIGSIAQAAAVVLVYLDLRMRREGLDLRLQRFVEEGGEDPLARASSELPG